MGKAKAKSQKVATVPHKHLHSRISYLYQAASYLANVKRSSADSVPTKIYPEDSPASIHPEKPLVVPEWSTRPTTIVTSPSTLTADEERSQVAPAITARVANSLQRQMVSHLHAVSLKAQIRLSPALKRTVCKRCHTLLIPGSTCHERLENLSRGGKKPWADILILHCDTCGTQKRTPVRAARQKNMSERSKDRVPH